MSGVPRRCMSGILGVRARVGRLCLGGACLNSADKEVSTVSTGCIRDERRGLRGFVAYVALLAMWASATVQPAASQERFRFESTPGRLSKNVVPSRYRLQLGLDPARDTFDGRAEIEVRVRARTDAIELHAHELQAVHAQLVS